MANATVYLTKEIGAEGITFDDFLKYWPTSADDVTIIINSPGGEVYDGEAMVNHIREVRAKGVKVHCKITGICGSEATMIALACDDREIAPNAVWFIHKAELAVKGNADVLTQATAELNRIDDMMATAYAEKTGMGKEAMIELMKQAKSIPAENAKSYGFVEGITNYLWKAVAKMAPDIVETPQIVIKEYMLPVVPTALAVEVEVTQTEDGTKVEVEVEKDSEVAAVEAESPALEEAVEETEEAKQLKEMRALVEAMRSEIAGMKTELAEAKSTAEKATSENLKVKAKLTQVPKALETRPPAPVSIGRIDPNVIQRL